MGEMSTDLDIVPHSNLCVRRVISASSAVNLSFLALLASFLASWRFGSRTERWYNHERGSVWPDNPGDNGV